MVLETGSLSVFKDSGVPFSDEASSYYIQISSDLLSEPYELKDGDNVKGEVLTLIDMGFDHPEFRKLPVTFILQRSVPFDKLYILKKEWQTNFRDRGLVRATYRINVTLIEAITKMKTIKLYPNTTVGSSHL
jgi:hypothetical protein